MVFIRRFVIFLAALILVGGGLLFAAGHFLIVGDDLERADLCLVLGGPKHRTLHAIKLYHDDLCGRLLFINGHENGQSLAENRKALALEQGVPAEDIAIDPTGVHSTYTELAQLKAFLDADPATSPALITLVSDPYHMRRTRIVFHWIFEDATPLQMAPVPFDLTTEKRLWWTDYATARMVGLEYVKLVYYWLRYRLPFAPLNDWLAQFETI